MEGTFSPGVSFVDFDENTVMAPVDFVMTQIPIISAIPIVGGILSGGIVGGLILYCKN